MSILLTGGAGFIGSHIADILISNNYDVVVVDNLATGKRENVNNNAKFYEIDIREPVLEKAFQENNIEYVIHEAAQASVGASMANPVYDMSVNIAGTLNLLNLSAKYGVKKFVAASTAAVYGCPEYLPVDEKHPVSCFSFYGLSKYTMEQYIKLMGEANRLDYIIFRYSNVYGQRQDAHGEAGVVSIFLDKMKGGQSVEIHGDGSQTRDFINVADIARANLLSIQSECKNRIINLSNCSQISINELFNTIKNITGYDKSPVYTAPRAGDIKDSCLDNTLARELLGWNPEVSLKDGLLSCI
ncbi:MAG: NAD-dependent epimerase/dehydratase family protein [Candidatus Gastranaerophilales bacterium]|nr:NAD-dependent epimerase/dehydratase family protein [Candidatus Gastranaerophilales bacterium]